MAVTVSNVERIVDGQRRVVLADVTFDSAYATGGGEAINAVDFGLYSIARVVPLGNPSGYNIEYASGKLKLYTAFSGTLSTSLSVESDARDASAIVASVLVIGN